MALSKKSNPSIDESYCLWADSFHEGEWACRAIAIQIGVLGGTYSVEYKQGFIPWFTFNLNGISFEITVYGNYASWEPIPLALAELLAWGKPDLVLIKESTDQILLAVEETAATPTGNQALQRCERQFGAAREGIPFWYLIAEYGVHTDGGVRRDSIWPTLMGLELMASTKVPSIVLHYSDASNPEDYSSGTGVSSLFKVLTQVLINATKDLETFQGLEGEIKLQVEGMLSFVSDSWSNSLYLISDLSKLNVLQHVRDLCSKKNKRIRGTNNDHQNFLKWPLTSDLSDLQKTEQQSRSLIKFDPLAVLLERDVANGRAYGIIKGSGSKPQKRSSLITWIDLQNNKHEAWTRSSGNTSKNFSLKISDFPVSPSGLHHVITAPRILYLYDSASIVQKSLVQAFPRLTKFDLFEDHDLELPALVYISNSVKPGRIFGDPYTGQISAYSVSFGALSGSRKVIAYFPHQSIAQAAQYLAEPNNKGLRIMAELTDLLVFGGGLIIKTKNLELI